MAELKRLGQARRYGVVIARAHALLSRLQDAGADRPDPSETGGRGDALEAQLAIYDQLGGAQRAMRQHDAAHDSHAAAFALKGRTGATAGQYLISYVEMATDRYLGFRFEEALGTITAARQQLKQALSAEASGLLLKLEAFVLYCTSDFTAAVAKMAAGRKKDVALNPGAAASESAVMDAVRHRLYLSCLLGSIERSVAAAGGAGVPGSAALAAKAGKQHGALSKALLDIGDWKDPLQLPKRYDPRLLARPWWHPAPGTSADAGATWPQLVPLSALLASYHAGLVAEYFQLKAGGHLLTDQDCIQEGNRGEWSRFEITGIWNDIGADGCSVHSPVACEMLGKARAVSPVAILRLGYSAIQPDTWIKPHFGMTNTMLKYHLGLIVPPDGCATMRVANETRPWVAGSVLMFDDSFEHEVRNDCGTERVVFQLAIKHPQLQSDPHYQAVVVDAH